MEIFIDFKLINNWAIKWRFWVKITLGWGKSVLGEVIGWSFEKILVRFETKEWNIRIRHIVDFKKKLIIIIEMIFKF